MTLVVARQLVLNFLSDAGRNGRQVWEMSEHGNAGSADPSENGATDLLHEPTYPVAVGAQALRKSTRWYEEQLRKGRLPGHKAGRSWYLTASDIAAAIQSTARRPH
ncbi:hypothetical protein, partial [Nocardia abscessus]|uniref:hypothetical protein n=1 Tax=Nocardia abscessus TaxID=120957 RepID=UPI003CC80E53